MLCSPNDPDTMYRGQTKDSQGILAPDIDIPFLGPGGVWGWGLGWGSVEIYWQVPGTDVELP